MTEHSPPTDRPFEPAPLPPVEPPSAVTIAIAGPQGGDFTPGTTMCAALATGACTGDDPILPPVQPGAAVITGNISQNRTLYADTVYQLRGIVQVTNQATLTIQPGTKITGSPIADVANRVSALIIMRGARLVAEGTRERPIVFTSAAAGGASDPRYPGDWGGLVIVGNAIFHPARLELQTLSGALLLQGQGEEVVAPGASCRSQIGDEYGEKPPHPVRKLEEALS